jgi:hypothetical protein
LRDCNDPTLLERLSLLAIRVGCWLMHQLRMASRPGATSVAALLLLFGLAQFAKAQEWPSPQTWEQTSDWEAAFVVLTAAASAAAFLVAVGFRLLLSRHRTSQKFATAAQGLKLLVANHTGIKHEHIGVNIWRVRGLPGFRRLVREASTTSQMRSETPIVWTKDKGVIGEAWGRDTSRFADLDAVRKLYPSETLWCELDRSDRFRLSWREFGETRRYHAVLAVPLHGSRYARFPVRGVVAIDVLTPTNRTKVEGVQSTAEFSSIIRTCEAALSREE